MAVFDTAFHQTLPQQAYLYAIPYSLYKDYGIRRYGFHGTSHRFVTERAASLLERPLGKCAFVSAHLGNGCSACAVLGREADLDDALQATDTCIVLQKSLVATVLQELGELGQEAAAETRLGLTWPLLRHVVSSLGFPSYPRDRSIEKIDLTTRDMLIATNLLFREKAAGRTV